jgi:UDP-glucose 4-epimerase
MKRVWVLGSGGMLGAAVIRNLLRCAEVHVFRYEDPFDWASLAHIREQFQWATQEFFAELSGGDDWEIYWAAGVGTMGASKPDLDGETAALGAFLSALHDQLPQCLARGVIAYASSAGALYAGCTDFEISETSVVTGGNDYARTKLCQEKMLEDFVMAFDRVQLLVARFSTLYGPGQAIDKRQGLLTHVARCALRHQPIEIFVPLDTSRDYLFVDDAACDWIEAAGTLFRHSGKAMVKIIAAERSVTISEIVATFNRLLKKQLRIVCSRNILSSQYAQRVSYRSIVPRAEGANRNRHTLLEGAAELLRSERMIYIARSTKGTS